VESLQAANLIVDEARRIVLVSQEYCDMFGIAASPQALV